MAEGWGNSDSDSALWEVLTVIVTHAMYVSLHIFYA